MRVLVTGGGEFIGHHLVKALLERGDDVVVLDNFSAGFRDRLTPVLGTIELVEGDLRSQADTLRATVACEVVYHQAAIPSVARWVVDPLRSNSVNVDGTIQLMLACAANRVRRVVAAGSSSVYGASPSCPGVRRSGRTRAALCYSKLATEHYMHTLGDLHGIQTVVLRYFNVFGPGQGAKSPICRRRAPVHHRGSAGYRTHSPRRWPPVAGLHLHRERGVSQPAGWRRAGRDRADRQRRLRRPIRPPAVVSTRSAHRCRDCQNRCSRPRAQVMSVTPEPISR